jgi:hypothetical protein
MTGVTHAIVTQTIYRHHPRKKNRWNGEHFRTTVTTVTTVTMISPLILRRCVIRPYPESV